MDKSKEIPKKCFCARCFLPIEAVDKVDIEGQNFHKICSMCCICRAIPPSLKMFYGHVFCSDCFKIHVMSRFRGEPAQMHTNSWWMQWAPGANTENAPGQWQGEAAAESAKPEPPSEPPKKCICARCLQQVADNDKVEIGSQSFHCQCARCYFCHSVPKNSVKIYYGQVFCEECFHQYVLNRNKDNPSEFFKFCFEQWQGNGPFADNMQNFMKSNYQSTPSPFIFMNTQPPNCRCGTGPQDWHEPREHQTTATPTPGSIAADSVDLSFEYRADASDVTELVNAEDAIDVADEDDAAEKIEKLTKYLHDRSFVEKPRRFSKKWKNFETSIEPGVPVVGWVDLQRKKGGMGGKLKCPKCLWQSGLFHANSAVLPKEIFCSSKARFE